MKRSRTRTATRSKAAKAKIQSAVGKTMAQMKRTALKVADVTGAVVSTASKKVKREMARRHLKQKMKRTGKALKAVAKTAFLAGAAAGATRAAQEIAAVRRA